MIRCYNAWCRRNADSYIRWMRRQGVRIGSNTKIFAHPRNICIDVSRPWLVEIGKNVQITRGVVILTHGYDWSVIKGSSGEVLGSAGKITIGDNCFIGMNAVILKGSTIGENCIVGAGSVVTGVVPSNSVAVGNPARVIMSLSEYRKKRIDAQKKEAKLVVQEYFKVYKKIPDESVLAEFMWLFAKRSKLSNPSFIQKMNCVGNFEYSMDIFLGSAPTFESYDSFIDYCFDGEQPS